jgi:hypothetical protein
MRSSLPLLALGTLFLVTPHANPPRTAVPQPQAALAQSARTPVIVELFTSEGCSSCPPAEELLSKLETSQPIEGAEIIGLEEHVDYWNHDGWVDSYSSADWTLRQQEYVDRFKGKTPYTPQMIVDGQTQFTGNSAHDALDAIREAAHRPKAQISITAQTSTKSDAAQFEVQVGSLASFPDKEPSDVWLAVTEEGLETAVKAGENAGKNLQHAAIVRSLHKIGAVPFKDSSPFVTNQQVKFKANWKKENLHIVVFVQERKSLRILGATAARATG